MYSNMAGTFTSVSKKTLSRRSSVLKPNPSLKVRMTGKFCHAIFGVVVIFPYAGDDLSRQTGPNEAIPRESGRAVSLPVRSATAFIPASIID